MKIIRPSARAIAVASLCAPLILSCSAQEFSENERHAVAVAIQLVEGNPAVAHKKLNDVCAELVTLLRDTSCWTELRALLEEYAQLNPASVKLYQRPLIIKQIIDRLIDLKNRGKLPAALVDAVEKVNKAALLKRLNAMLAA